MKLKHVIVDIEDISGSKRIINGVLNSVSVLEKICKAAVRASGMDVVNEVTHSFPVQGVTISLILAESHLMLHTWPEEGKYYIDVFACGDKADPFKCIYRIWEALGGKIIKIQTVR